jgi:hypothetical protein
VATISISAASHSGPDRSPWQTRTRPRSRARKRTRCLRELASLNILRVPTFRRIKQGTVQMRQLQIDNVQLSSRLQVRWDGGYSLRPRPPFARTPRGPVTRELRCGGGGGG